MLRDDGTKPAYRTAVNIMLVWALAFLFLALLAAFFGFGMAAVTFAVAAKLVFYAAVVLFLISLISVWMRRA